MTPVLFPRSLFRFRRRPARRGFALLLVITLLAFVVLLLIGLALFARVETAVAGNTQRQAQARENALLALNVALGHLQQYAGPDTRITATAHHFGAIDGTRHYTGVWSSDVTATDAPRTPLTWLVSGNELRQPDTSEGADSGSTTPAPLAITPAAPGPQTVDLIGRNATDSEQRNADYVIAPLTEIKANGVPGRPATSASTIGRYAWWVGDQGVKASVAAPDATAAVTFAPYDSADLRRRIWQQLSGGAGATDASSGAPLFEPFDDSNRELVTNERVTATNQLAFLRTTSNAAVGLARVRENMHAWSPNNFAVLANPKLGGLREDLSLAPTKLGNAFAAWANYAAYMEPFGPQADESANDSEATAAPPIQPVYGPDPLRRRYRMTRANGESPAYAVAPILSFFGLSFSFRNNHATAPTALEVSVRCSIGLWNPYTSALVPERDGLQLVVSGLPTVTVSDSSGNTRDVDLQQVMGADGLKFFLPWTTSSDVPDRASWLPGRVHNWAAEANVTDPGEPGNITLFGVRDPRQGSGMVRPAGAALATSSTNALVFRQCSVSTPTTLTVELRRVSDGAKLAEFRSLEFQRFETSPSVLETEHLSADFAFVFRLPDALEIPPGASTPWLAGAGRDPREPSFSGYIPAGGNEPNPALFGGGTAFIIAYPSLLLDRPASELSYNQDAPLFELPRSPLLSLGALQHLHLPGQRPFTMGNPWGASAAINGLPTGALFDRYFFSGLTADVAAATTANGDLIAPNALLKPLRKPDRTKITLDDIRALMNPPSTTDPDGNVLPGPPPSAFSSKYFLQGGAFNLNSTNTTAWAAVLRGIRFPTTQRAFTYLDVAAETGSASDEAIATAAPSTDARFFRFSQSAQETFKAESGLASDDPENPSPANTHLFRQGMRALDPVQVAAFAAKIVELIGTKHTAADPQGGPFRSLEEFLAPSTLFAGVDAEGNPGVPRSLLEAAIADTNLNANIAEFSSQWLTQADVMTALAPILFPRSDTFVIRTYGEAVNPAKLNADGSVPAAAIEGRAWAEAIVQRVPEYFDPRDPPETPPAAFDLPENPDAPDGSPSPAHQLNKLHGRRFKVVSFRWLTRSDI